MLTCACYIFTAKPLPLRALRHRCRHSGINAVQRGPGEGDYCASRNSTYASCAKRKDRLRSINLDRGPAYAGELCVEHARAGCGTIFR